VIIYSKRSYCFAEAVNDALQPDVGVPITRKDYAIGNDPTLSWIVRDIAARKLSNQRQSKHD
jgi:hypothetical protein